MDVTVGGHYEAGESIEDGIREMKEEIGIVANFSDLIPLGERQTSVILAENYDNNEFQHIFLYPTTYQLQDFSFDDSEVNGLVEVPILDGLDLMQHKIDTLNVQGVFNSKNNKPEISTLSIKRDDFVPAYLKTDDFMIRLFIAAKRYIEKEDLRYLYW